MIDKMTNEEKLDHLLRLTDENNRILRSMNRRQILSSIFRLVYLSLIVASLVAAYYFIKPIMNSFSEGQANGSTLMQQLENLKSQLPSTEVFNQMMKSEQ